jgi:hypothetical protein
LKGIKKRKKEEKEEEEDCDAHYPLFLSTPLISQPQP